MDVRQRLQRGGECSYEVAVSATCDGCDQELEVERSRRRWGDVDEQNERDEQEEERRRRRA